jgi:nucleotide-binding universal stress UspA family protein
MKAVLLIVLILALQSCEQSKPPAPPHDVKEGLWWTYMADYDGIPGSTVVDMALKEKAPLAALSTALVTGVSYESEAENSGLPDAAEFDLLNRLADERLAIIKAKAKHVVHVGTFTSDQKRYDYFYLAEPDGLEDALRQFYREQCPNRQPYVNIAEDPQWERYLEFLYPNSQTIQFYRPELEKLDAIDSESSP